MLQLCNTDIPQRKHSMSESRRYKSTYFTFFAALGAMAVSDYSQLSEEQAQAWSDKVQAVQTAAYAAMEKALPTIPGYREPYTDGDVAYEVEQFELCADDVLLEERAGQMTYGLGFFTEQKVKPELLQCVQEVVRAVYRSAGEAAGMSAELVALETQVTEEVRRTETTVL